MQVNTVWLTRIAAWAHIDIETTRARLIDDPCFNIAAAGAILRVELDAADGNLLLAIGHYHSHTPALADAYRARVINAATVLFQRGAKPAG
jgi:soluble lytic murein transglycosylase-like protein